jgi:site-specific DNA-methyltransferase (adenine-specific)
MTKPYYQDEAVTIYHGDCREIVPTLNAVDFIWTDPPYGHNNNNGDLIARREAALGRGESPKDTWRPIANDGPESNNLVRWFFLEAYRLLKPDCCCCCCCCGGGGPAPQFARWSLWLDEAFHGGFKQMVVWDKGPMGMGWHYRRSYETVLVAQKGKGKWRGGRTVENIIRPGSYGIRKIIPSASDHPTPKPVELPAAFIQWHTDVGDTLLDPFAGGGTTGRAAKDLGRKAVLIELEERYCEMAANRMAQAVLPFAAKTGNSSRMCKQGTQDD